MTTLHAAVVGGCTAALPALLQDAYGNFVAQTVLQSATPAERLKLIAVVRPVLAQLRSSAATGGVVSKWSAILDRMALADAPPAPAAASSSRPRP